MKKKIFLLFLSFTLTIVSKAQWQPDVRLTNNSAESHTSPCNAWCVAANGDTIHVIWFDSRDGLDEIYYKRSPDRGISWTQDTRLTYSNSYAQYPSVFVWGNVVHIVWQDMRNGWEIYYKRSTDAGTTWGVDVRLTNDAGNSWNPTVYASGSIVHVLWNDTRNGNTQAYYKRSPDGGISWGSDIRLDTAIGDSWHPVTASTGSLLHAMWCDNRNGNYEIYYKRSTDLGLSWGTDRRITNTSSNSTNPSFSIIGSIIHLIFSNDQYGGDPGCDVYYKRSTDLGTTWGSDTRLTTDPNRSEYASVAASGSNIHSIWDDNRDGNYEIYYKYSSNGGLTWGPDTRLTNASGNSFLPSMVLSGSYIHVVWMDYRDGNYEIYYKQNPTGNGPLPIPAAPNMLSPPNGSQYQPTSIRFTWNKSQYADTYRLQVASDSLFNVLVVNDSTLTDSTIIVTGFLVNHNYWWRVNAKNLSGTSQWSVVFHFNTNLVGIQHVNSEIPREYKLYPNFPNPFNPITKIKFDIPSGVAGQTFLSVYDILGREVATLVNEKLSPGTYEVEWPACRTESGRDASNFASGIYFYKLETESFTQTKRMVLIK